MNTTNFSINISLQSTTINYDTIGARIGTIVYSIIYAIGFIGNSLSLLTFSSSKMRQISSSIFLLVLSISDTLSLITSWWFFLSDAFNIQLQTYSALACRFRSFFAYVFMDTSSWCIAALSFDRFIRSELPIKSQKICTPKNASITIIIVFLVLCGINGHYLSAGIGQERTNSSSAHCSENRYTYPKYSYFYKIIWPKIDIIVFCFLPACIMIFSNIKLVYNIHHQQHHTNTKTKSSQSSSHKKAMERQMRLMMIACVIVFLITTVPVTIYLLLIEQVFIGYKDFSKNYSYYIFIFRLLRALMYFHFACNFYLHCLTSRIFRTEFMRIITCERLMVSSQPNGTTHHTTF